ncbi:MAG: TetR/AcrR family transcriptional regulator, partial [Acidobacteria bacterium]|nr:TetR/AcrR family transcriptional regulator [Acidobacteriota bacterium]
MRVADPHNPTKEKILQAALRLMLAKGFKATSVDEICEEADATKGSFFHFFESKEEMAKVLAERFVCQQMEMAQAAEFQKLKDPLARVLGWIDYVIGALNNPAIEKSCLVGNFSQELAPTHPGVRAVCADGFDRWSKP